MSRKIPRTTKDEAFRLWLQGCSYREIRDRTGMSLGAINQVVAEARGRVPNVEELRELNVVLKKDGSTIYDAMRGGLLLSALSRLGVGLDMLDSYIKLSNRMSSERGVEAERFVEASIRLMNLETKTGKNYEGVLKDFEERTRQIEGLEAKAKDVQGEIQRLMERRAQLEGEKREAEERLSLTHQELNRAITTQERLQKLGLEKTSTLSEFIEDYEFLGFNAQEVQKLAEWRKSLAKIGIDSDRLESFIKKRGPLEKQLRLLNEELSQRKARLKILATMERETQDIKRIRYLMDMKKAFACGYCGSQFFHELRRFEVSQCLAMGQLIIIPCQKCGAPNTYNPHEVLARLGFEVLS